MYIATLIMVFLFFTGFVIAVTLAVIEHIDHEREKELALEREPRRS